MSALGADRNTPKRDGKTYSCPVLTATEIFAGSLVVRDSSGWAKPGVTGTGLVCMGRANEYVDNTGASGAKNVEVEAGIFRWANGESITKAHIGDTAFILDDQTVYLTATGKSPAGIIVDVDSEGVWVQTDPAVQLVSTGLLAANNLSDLGTVATAIANLELQDGSKDLALDTTTFRNKLVAGAAAYTVGSDEDGDAVITTATDNAVITLPDAAAGNAGKRITVINTGADGAALISVAPHASDGIFGTVPNAAADGVSSGTVNKPFNNTKATANKGDHVILVSDGSTGWYIVGGVGIWASTP